MGTSPEQRAADYATNTLGVDAVYAETREHYEALGTAHERVRTVRAERRTLAEEMAQRESQIVAEKRPDYASDTAFKTALSGLLHDDQTHAKMRQHDRQLQADLETAEHAVREAEFGIRMGAARMTELGGLLTFYGAVKTTQTASKRESE